MFVDISGFTALSERLTKRGRVGAEELTDTLSSVFAELLTSAYASGGSLLKFGGDALLLLFDGDAHQTRAATTAMRMRTALGDRGPIKTDGGGAIRLRMSVGVHSGDLHFFRVGTSHKELIVTGPGASAVCRMEATAQAGDVLVSPSTAAAIPRDLLGAARDPGHLLKRRREPGDASGYPTVRAAAQDLSVAIPVALRDALAHGVEPEHRMATIAFVHFDGTDDFLAEHGAEATAAALDELVSAVQAAADDEHVTFLGSDLDHNGGKLILVGGAPRAFGDDEGRVLRAARRVLDTPTTIPVRIGVHRGHVFAGEVGPVYRRTYTVMGDTVNLSARLMAKAEPGQMIATADVLDNAQTAFATQAMPPFLVKGKSAPINAFLVGEVSGRRRRAGSDQLPFVGRSDEFDEIKAAWDAARDGRGGFVAVYGDAGIGKSRLLREFAHHAPDVRTVTAYCETYQASTPYFAARYLMRGALGLSTHNPSHRDLETLINNADPALLPWLPLVAAVLDVDAPSTPEVDGIEPQFRRARTVQVIVELLSRVVSEPIALVADDAHWLDELSGELLVGIAAAAHNRPWLVVVAGRVEVDSYAPPVEAVDRTLTLAPLDEQAARTLLTSADQTASMRPDQRDAILQRSGGNPLFLEQLAARNDDSHDLPDSLEALIAAEVDALSTRDRQILRLGAVLGPIFDNDLLLQLVDEPSHAAVFNASVARFLEPVGALSTRFRNQTYRDVVYETLSFGRRRELHNRALHAIEDGAEDPEDFAEVLSFHALYARDYARCWRYSIAAANEAQRSFANVEAATLFERALQVGTQPGIATRGELADTWEGLGDVSIAAGTYERAKRAFDKARVLAEDAAAAQASLCRKEALVAMHRGQPTALTRWVKRGMEMVLLATDDESVRVRSELRMMLGEALQRRRRTAEAIHWAELAREDAVLCGNKAALARSYSLLGYSALDAGDLASAAQYLQESLHMWEAENKLHDEAAVATVLGAVAYYRAEWDDAAEYFRRAEAGFQRTGDVVNAGYGTCNLADILIDQGRASEVVDGVTEVVRVWRAVGHPDPVPGALVNLGRCALETGNLEEAVARLTEARSLSSGNSSARVLTDYWLAECALRAGDAATALASVTDLIAIEQSLGGTYLPQLHRLRGLALAVLMRFDEAVAEEETSLRIAGEQGAAFQVAQTVLALDACHAALGSRADAALRDDAYATLERLGVRDVQLPLPAA